MKRDFRWWWKHVYVEFVPLSGRFALEFRVDSESDHGNFRLSICLAAFSLYIGFKGHTLYRWAKVLTQWQGTAVYSGEARNIGIQIFDWGIWWECWAPAMSWSKREPWWMRWTFHPLDALFGTLRLKEETVRERHSVVIPMPEAVYPCTVLLKQCVWRRSRWPFAWHRVDRAEIDCPRGIPIPGKGENSWDIDDDAVYGLTTMASTPEQAIAAITESVYNSRRRHGGSVGWRPHHKDHTPPAA